MIRIEPKDWFQNIFAITTTESDLLRQPLELYTSLSEIEKDQIRQTQIFSAEVVQILANYEEFHLIRKFDQTLGWVEKDSLAPRSQLKDFAIEPSPFKKSKDFLEEWRGVKYLFGGISKSGIDCSGFTQKYFWDVHGKIIPKNSRDQRKMGTVKNTENFQNNDLIFCHRKGSEVHHVVLFYENEVWHARPKQGVVSQSLNEFKDQFDIETIVHLL